MFTISLITDLSEGLNQKSNARNPLPHDAGHYAMRNTAERLFCQMKDMRRLAARFEKLGRAFLSMIHLFAIR